MHQPRRAGLFCLVGATSATGWLDGISLDVHGVVLTGADSTNQDVASAWTALGRPRSCSRRASHACSRSGDVRPGSTKRVTAVVGEGAGAILSRSSRDRHRHRGRHCRVAGANRRRLTDAARHLMPAIRLNRTRARPPAWVPRSIACRRRRQCRPAVVAAPRAERLAARGVAQRVSDDTGGGHRWFRFRCGGHGVSEAIRPRRAARRGDEISSACALPRGSGRTRARGRRPRVARFRTGPQRQRMRTPRSGRAPRWRRCSLAKHRDAVRRP